MRCIIGRAYSLRCVCGKNVTYLGKKCVILICLFLGASNVQTFSNQVFYNKEITGLTHDR